MSFQISAGHRSGIKEFVYDVDGSVFLKRGWWGLVWIELVHDCTHILMPIHVFQEHLTCFFNVKSITLHTWKVVH